MSDSPRFPHVFHGTFAQPIHQTVFQTSFRDALARNISPGWDLVLAAGDVGMVSIPHLESLFHEGKKWLAVCGQQAWIAEQQVALEIDGDSELLLSINLEEAYRRFQSRAEPFATRSLSLGDLAVLAGISYAAAHRWSASNALHSVRSGRQYTFGVAEAFAASLLGALSRAGTDDIAMRKVAALVTKGSRKERSAHAIRN
jgi:hypothetical protein